PGDKEAYTLTVDEVLTKVEFAAREGATTVLLQGGHNPALPLEYYLELVRQTRRRFPSVTPHFFSASEIRTMSDVAGKPVPEVLSLLKHSGGRGRGALRAGAQADRAEEGRAGRVARGAPGGAPPGIPVHRYHDVRPRRAAGGRPRPPRRDPGAAGRARRLHRLRPVVLQA